MVNKASILYLFILSYLFSIIFNVSDALAANDLDAVSGVLCAIIEKLNGPIGRNISAIGVIVLGVGFFLGKSSWGVAVAVAVGIGVIFGSQEMVKWIANAGSDGALIGDFCL
jgi:type IV secretion system protein VirB2